MKKTFSAGIEKNLPNQKDLSSVEFTTENDFFFHFSKEITQPTKLRIELKILIKN